MTIQTITPTPKPDIDGMIEDLKNATTLAAFKLALKPVLIAVWRELQTIRAILRDRQ
jgi:hypothetical protein